MRKIEEEMLEAKEIQEITIEATISTNAYMPKGKRFEDNKGFFIKNNTLFIKWNERNEYEGVYLDEPSEPAFDYYTDIFDENTGKDLIKKETR